MFLFHEMSKHMIDIIVSLGVRIENTTNTPTYTKMEGITSDAKMCYIIGNVCESDIEMVPNTYYFFHRNICDIKMIYYIDESNKKTYTNISDIFKRISRVDDKRKINQPVGDYVAHSIKYDIEHDDSFRTLFESQLGSIKKIEYKGGRRYNYDLKINNKIELEIKSNAKDIYHLPEIYQVYVTTLSNVGESYLLPLYEIYRSKFDTLNTTDDNYTLEYYLRHINSTTTHKTFKYDGKYNIFTELYQHANEVMSITKRYDEDFVANNTNSLSKLIIEKLRNIIPKMFVFVYNDNIHFQYFNDEMDVVSVEHNKCRINITTNDLYINVFYDGRIIMESIDQHFKLV